VLALGVNHDGEYDPSSPVSIGTRFLSTTASGDPIVHLTVDGDAQQDDRLTVLNVYGALQWDTTDDVYNQLRLDHPLYIGSAAMSDNYLAAIDADTRAWSLYDRFVGSAYAQNASRSADQSTVDRSTRAIVGSNMSVFDEVPEQ
jgi:hypothetical protein